MRVLSILKWLLSPSAFSLAWNYLGLPKLLKEFWANKEKLYVYIYALLHSKFLEILVSKTPFYVDDALHAKLKILIDDKEGFYKVYDVINGISSVDTLPSSLWDLWNFVNTVKANRSLL